MKSDYRIIRLDVSESTNAQLKELAKKGEAEDKTVMTAKMQVSGHGQYGRSFESPEGGLYVSILRKLPIPLTFAQGELTVAVGRIAADLLKKDFGLNPTIKLPNDVLIDGKKICGILVESFTIYEEIDIIIGIGLNLNTDLDSFSDELRPKVTSVKTLCHKECSIDAVLMEIIEEVDLWFNSQKQF